MEKCRHGDSVGLCNVDKIVHFKGSEQLLDVLKTSGKRLHSCIKHSFKPVNILLEGCVTKQPSEAW